MSSFLDSVKLDFQSQKQPGLKISASYGDNFPDKSKSAKIPAEIKIHDVE